GEIAAEQLGHIARAAAFSGEFVMQQRHDPATEHGLTLGIHAFKALKRALHVEHALAANGFELDAKAVLVGIAQGLGTEARAINITPLRRNALNFARYATIEIAQMRS